MAPSAINDPFSSRGAVARTKVLLLGSSDLPPELTNRIRSLHIEHVSSAALRQREISRRSGSPGTNEAALIALWRRWFFTRKPDAGFVLRGFPATLLQAKVFDEWLEARSENLDEVFAAPDSPASVVSHYRDSSASRPTSAAEPWATREDAEGPLRPMIPIKDQNGIARMREACAVAATVLDLLKPLVRPGITTQDLEEAGRDAIHRLGARSACFGYQHNARRYPAHTCISVNEEVVHGIPSFRRVLREGDIVSLDIVVEYRGYIGDNAATVAIAPVAPEVQRLLRITREALDLGIREAQIGNHIGDISATVQQFVEGHGFSVVRDMVGHGVGVEMHEPPEIPNFGRRGTGAKIKPGMTLAIEPMVNLGGYKTKTLSDGWTIVTADGSPSAHFEHTVLTTVKGPEILTRPRS